MNNAFAIVTEEWAEYWKNNLEIDLSENLFLRIFCVPEDIEIYGYCPERVTYEDFIFAWYGDHNSYLDKIDIEQDEVIELYGIKIVCFKHQKDYIQGAELSYKDGAISFYHPVAEKHVLQPLPSLNRVPGMPDYIYVIRVLSDNTLLSIMHKETQLMGVLCCVNEDTAIKYLFVVDAANGLGSAEIMKVNNNMACNCAEFYNINGLVLVDSLSGTEEYFSLSSPPIE